MTAGELIGILQPLDPRCPVVLPGSQWYVGVQRAQPLELTPLEPFDEYIDPGFAPRSKPTVTVIALLADGPPARRP